MIIGQSKGRQVQYWISINDGFTKKSIQETLITCMSCSQHVKPMLSINSSNIDEQQQSGKVFRQVTIQSAHISGGFRLHK